MYRYARTMLLAVVCASAVLVAACASAVAAEAVVTTGVGYKKMLEALCEAYRQQGGTVEEMYGGNIGQMLAQIEQGSGATIVVNDRGTLDEVASNVEFEHYEDIGGTVLVLAWRKGVELTAPGDLEKPEIERVCHADPKAAIYGRAAAKFLESSGIGANIAAKLSVVSTVPQVFAYLVSGDMDAGFVNRVVVRNGADKIGGSLEIESGYPPLNVVAAVVKGHADDPETVKFLEFLRSPEAREILKKNGVW